jgi:RNA polymerase sigma-70 factor (ECF subfamily)
MVGTSLSIHDDPEPNNTRDILARIQAGERSAIDELYARYETRILTWVRAEMGARLAASIQAEDLKQEVMLRSIGQVERIADVPHLRWLFARLAKQVVVDAARKRATDKRDPAKEVAIDAESGIELEQRGTRPSAPAQQEELMLLYSECLGAMSEDHRKVLYLRHQAGMAYRDVAAELERSEEAAVMLLGRAEAKLKECLRKKGVAC